ncbi:hypothetical protein CR513_57164, partial [Mucuna pruriens]
MKRGSRQRELAGEKEKGLSPSMRWIRLAGWRKDPTQASLIKLEMTTLAQNRSSYVITRPLSPVCHSLSKSWSGWSIIIMWSHGDTWRGKQRRPQQ